MTAEIRPHSYTSSADVGCSTSEKKFTIKDFVHHSETDYDSFQTSFTDYFGERLACKVEQLYGKKETITSEEIKQRLVSIAALVKKEDLQSLFEHIKEDPENVAQIFSIEVQMFLEVEDFEELNDQQLNILLGVFRDFPNEHGTPMAVGTLFFPLKTYPKIPPGNPVFQKHLKMVRSFERVTHFMQLDAKAEDGAIRQELAGSEHLCREIAYGLPLNSELEKQVKLVQKHVNHAELQHNIQLLVKEELVGTIFPALNEEGGKVFYEINGAVFEQGLVLFYCTPITRGQWQKEDEDTPYPIKAIFRGTWCWSSLKRDLTEGMEVGQNSFFGLCPSVIDRLRESIPDGVENVDIEVGGHSLGGVDASRLVVLLARLREERIRLGKGHASKLDAISSVRLTTWNAPGMLKRTCREYNAHRRSINRANESREEKGKKTFPLSFYHTHVKVREDALQNFGRTMLGWVDPKVARKYCPTLKKDGSDIDCDDTRIIKFHFKKFLTVLGTTFFAHRLPCLSFDARENIMIVKTGKINRKLGTRSLVRWVKLIAKAVFRRAVRIPKKVYAVVKSFVVKEAKKDYHSLYEILGIRDIFSPVYVPL